MGAEDEGNFGDIPEKGTTPRITRIAMARLVRREGGNGGSGMRVPKGEDLGVGGGGMRRMTVTPRVAFGERS
jgi:hypothetical protein